MPEPLIQKATNYVADKHNKGKVTPQIEKRVHNDPATFDHTLHNMYTDKYRTQFNDFDKFKSAYIAEHGDPFKKKAQTTTTSKPSVSVPAEGAQGVQTFQPQETRKTVSSETALQPLSPSAKQSEKDSLLSDQYSSGLLQKASPQEIQNIQEKPKASNLPEISGESTQTPTEQPTLEQVQEVKPYVPNVVADYLKPFNRAVYDAIPQAIKVAHNLASYGAEVLGSDPQAYTFEELKDRYDKGNFATKALDIITLSKAATMWHDFNERNMTASPEVESSVLGQLSSGLGQGATMIAGSGLAGMLNKSSQMLQAANYANTLSKSATLTGAATQALKGTLTAPSTTIAATQVFNQEFDDAYKATGDPTTAMKSAVINTVGSAGLEAMPIMHFIDRMDDVTGGGVQKLLVNGLKGGLEEMTTEVMQQGLSNVVASDLYDKTRQITDGMVESGEVGGITGFALNVLGAALGAKLRGHSPSQSSESAPQQNETIPPDEFEKQEIQKSIDYINEKKAEFDQKQELIAANMENQLAHVKTSEMQEQIKGENITSDQIAKMQAVMETMPNSDEIKPKTIGITTKITDLLLEKEKLYNNVLSVAEQDKADIRAKEIDSQIRELTNTAGAIFANPSTKTIEEHATKTRESQLQKEHQGSSELVQGNGENRIEHTTQQSSSGETGGSNSVLGKQEEISPEHHEDLTDPVEIARKYHEERLNPTHISPKEQAIAQVLTSGVSNDSVIKQGDKNKLNQSMVKSYVREGGNRIDQVAQQASTALNESGHGDEVSPEEVWDFMNKFPQGPDQIARPAGNPRLKELADKHLELTGKRLDKLVAEKLVLANKAPKMDPVKEDPNSVIEKYTDEKGNVKLDELESDISALPFLYDLTPEETKIVEDYVREIKKTNGVSGESAIPEATSAEATAEKRQEIVNDSVNLSPEAFKEKHPEEDQQENKAEFTKDTKKAIESNREGKTQEPILQMAGMVKAIPLDTRFTNATEKIKQAVIKATRVGGAIPFDLVFDYSYKRKNTIAQKISEMETLAKTAEKNAQKQFGKKIPKDITEGMNAILSGNKTDVDIPEHIIVDLQTLRNSIDALTMEMKNAGMIQDSMQGVFDENLGMYLNRSYKKWNDPVWKENIPEEDMNKAVAYLKEQYIQAYKEKFEKTQESFKNKGKRIRDFRTKISNQQTKVDENNARLAEYKTNHEAYISKLDDKIEKSKEVLKKRKSESGKAKIEKRIELLEATKSESIKGFEKIYEAKKSQFDRKNVSIQTAIAKAEEAAYNLQQKNYPEKMQEYMDKFTTPDEGEIGGIINQILYAPTSDMVQSGKVGGIKTGILKKRSDTLTNSPEIRALMGEYKDPYINFLNTTHKMVTALENYKFQKKLREDGMGIIFSPKLNNEFHRKIEGDAWKGLTEGGDLYTTEIFEEALQQLNGNIQDDARPGWFRQLVSAVKVGKTAQSLAGAFSNYTSNLWHLTSNAWNPKHAITKILGMNKVEWANEVKELTKLGILGQSSMGRELRDKIREAAGYNNLEKYVNALPAGEIVTKSFTWLTNKNAQLFELGDAYARVTGFYAEIERYRNAHPEWTEDQLRDNAAKIISKVSPTYDMAYPWVQQFRNSPWFSTFATFPAELVRTAANQGIQIKKDLSDPKTRSIGITRMAGVMAAGFGAYELRNLATYLIAGTEEERYDLNHFVASLLGMGDEEEKKEKDLSRFVSAYSKNSPIVYLSKDGGKYQYYDASRSMYHSYFMQPIIAYSHGNTSEEEFKKQLGRAVLEVSKPFLDFNIIMEAGIDAATGYNTGTDTQIWSENDSPEDAMLKLSKHLLFKLEPTNVKTVRSFYDLTQKGGKDEYGRGITPKSAIASAFGIKVRELDVNKAFSYEWFKQKEQGDHDKHSFERNYRNARDEGEKEKAIQLYKTELTNQVKKMSYMSQAAIRLGADIAPMKKALGKMPDHIDKAISGGDDFKPEQTEEYVNRAIIQYIYNIDKTKYQFKKPNQ